MDWEVRPPDASPNWVGHELAVRLPDRIALRLTGGEIVVGRFDDLGQDLVTVEIDVRGAISTVESATVQAYALLEEAIDHSDELRGV